MSAIDVNTLWWFHDIVNRESTASSWMFAFDNLFKSLAPSSLWNMMQDVYSIFWHGRYINLSPDRRFSIRIFTFIFLWAKRNGNVTHLLAYGGLFPLFLLSNFVFCFVHGHKFLFDRWKINVSQNMRTTNALSHRTHRT